MIIGIKSKTSNASPNLNLVKFSTRLDIQD